jgi:hypothetical protein
MRYRLRTLLIVLALVPPVLAGVWFAVQQPWFPVALLLVAIGTLGVGVFIPIAALVMLACFATDSILRLLKSRHRLSTLIALAFGGPLLIAGLAAMTYALWSEFQIPRY